MNVRRKAPRGLFLIVCIMQGFKIMISDFTKPVIDVLLITAAAVFMNDMGTFVNGLTVFCAIVIFCEVHEKAPFVFY